MGVHVENMVEMVKYGNGSFMIEHKKLAFLYIMTWYIGKIFPKKGKNAKIGPILGNKFSKSVGGGILIFFSWGDYVESKNI